jgi:hypothetical protein
LSNQTGFSGRVARHPCANGWPARALGGEGESASLLPVLALRSREVID